MYASSRRPALALIAVACLFCGCPGKRSPVADYFDHAELQCETDQQRESVVAALNDALALPAAELRARRYPDYTGREGQWDFATLLSRYLVPDRPGRQLGDDIYRAVTSPAGRRVVRDFLHRKLGPPGS